MKVLDPQSALLTTAEVHQFLKENPIREKDKKIGSYDIANVANNHLIRRDVEHYTQLVHPHVNNYPPVNTFMRQTFQRLKKYGLTKTEVYTLINLGVGLGPTPTTTTTPASTNDDDIKPEPNGDTNVKQEEGEEEEEAAQESDLPRSLFRLIVEESEDRFPDEQSIDEILGVIRECIQQGGGDAGEKVNGHAEKDQ